MSKHPGARPDSDTPASSFAVRLTLLNDDAVLWLEGEIDLASRPEIEAVVSSANKSHLLIDMHDVSFLDSSGIATLLRIRREGERAGRLTHVVWPSDRVRSVLRLAGLVDELVIDTWGARAS